MTSDTYQNPVSFPLPEPVIEETQEDESDELGI